MKLKALLCGSCISAVMLTIGPAYAAEMHACPADNATAASNTWNFKAEANNLFEEVRYDAQQAMDHADTLRSFIDDTAVSWEAHVDQLNYLRDDINDIGTKLCRLEAIQGVVAPWQKHVIVRIATTSSIMAGDTQDAIRFCNANQQALWLAAYANKLENLDDQAHNLTRSVGNAVEFASASKEYRDLGHKLGAHASS